MELNQQLKISSYILFYAWVIFYLISLGVYIEICFRRWDSELPSDLCNIIAKVMLGYFPFILFPSLFFVSFNSTIGIVLQGIALVILGSWQEGLPEDEG